MLVPCCRGPRQQGQFSASKVKRGEIKIKSKINRRRQGEFLVGTVETWEKSNRCRRKRKRGPSIAIATMILISRRKARRRISNPRQTGVRSIFQCAKVSDQCLDIGIGEFSAELWHFAFDTFLNDFGNSRIGFPQVKGE